MAEIDIKEATDKIKKEFGNLSKYEFTRATALAIDYALARGRTRVSQDARNVLNISAGDFKTGTLIQRARRTGTDKAYGAILATTKPLNVSRFNAKQITNIGVDLKTGKSINVVTQFMGRRRGANKGGYVGKQTSMGGSGIYIEVYKGQVMQIKSAFLLYAKSGNAAVMARGANQHGTFEFMQPRLPIAGITSKSIYTSIINPQVEKSTTPYVSTIYVDRLYHELTEGIKHWK